MSNQRCHVRGCLRANIQVPARSSSVQRCNKEDVAKRRKYLTARPGIFEARGIHCVDHPRLQGRRQPAKLVGVRLQVACSHGTIRDAPRLAGCCDFHGALQHGQLLTCEMQRKRAEDSDA